MRIIGNLRLESFHRGYSQRTTFWETKESQNDWTPGGKGEEHRDDTEQEQKASPMGPHSGDDVGKARGQGSFQFLGKPCHCPITMEIAERPSPSCLKA